MKLGELLHELQPQTILLIRSCPLEQFCKILEEIKLNLLNPKIHIIVQNELQCIFDTDQEFTYNDNVFSILRFNKLPLGKINKNKYDLLIVPCSNDNGLGYFNVRLFSFLFSSKKRFNCLINEEVNEFWILSVINEIINKNILPLKYIYAKIKYFIHLYIYNWKFSKINHSVKEL